jgi:hypothetical protein
MASSAHEYIHLYHLQKVQVMGPNDFDPSMAPRTICTGTQLPKLHLFFLMSVPLPRMELSTPETAMCGIKKILTRSHQNHFAVNVWAGIIINNHLLPLTSYFCSLLVIFT